MKIIIAGSRDIDDYNLLDRFMKKLAVRYDITEVISGTARGADKLGEMWATQNNRKLTEMPADWNKNGKAAGPIRNAEMLKVADIVLVLWDGESRGSKHMFSISKESGKPTFLYNTRTRHGEAFNTKKK